MGTAGAPFDANRVVVHGYDGDAVKRYLEAIDAECRRLEAEIAEARARIDRARRSIDGKRLLESMLHNAYDDIVAKRRQADVVTTRFAAVTAQPTVLDRAVGDGEIRWSAPEPQPSTPEESFELVSAS